MPRPRKHRRVCARPACTSFRPCGGEGQPVTLAFDEFEVIRLIDLEGPTQEQCAEQMDVARSTVQSIYASARRKLASCIVEGRPLDIGGGDVRFCEHRTPACLGGCCRWKNDPGKDETSGE